MIPEERGSKILLNIYDCKCLTFPPVLVGAEACREYALGFSVRLVKLHTHSTLAVHNSGEDGGAQHPHCSRV